MQCYEPKWYGKTQVMNCELRVESLKAKNEIQMSEFKYKSERVEIHELRVQLYELRV